MACYGWMTGITQDILRLWFGSLYLVLRSLSAILILQPKFMNCVRSYYVDL